LGGIVEFKFKSHHKLQRATQQTTLGHFQIELSCTPNIPNQNLFVLWRALVEVLIERLIDFWTNKMAVSEEAREITEMTVEEAA